MRVCVIDLWREIYGVCLMLKSFGSSFSLHKLGAAIEITGLVKSTLRWLAQLHSTGRYPHSGVRLPGGEVLTYAMWNARLQGSFESYFYVPLSREEDGQFHCDSTLVNKRGIYKVGREKREGEREREGERRVGSKPFILLFGVERCNIIVPHCCAPL